MVILPAHRYSDAEVAERLRTATGATRLRLLCPASAELLAAAFDAGVAVDPAPAIAEPTIELRRWVIEQAISRTMHRHGRLLRRARP
jgi:RHH-type proline utilization regulon transcriptional repressor/proline dehydrogenase/delta 1-pyrroline-5-carboxylate dehydrogenase